MKIIEVIQGTDEWKLARAGKVTASRIADVMSKLKNGGESAGRRNYRAEIVAEILTGKPYDGGYVSAEMQYGTDIEPFARAAYELRNNVMVDTVGLVIHPAISYGAASPDGLVGSDGLVEIKVPKTATHIDYLLAGTVPAEYQLQMLWQMACTGREWCDFVSFDPRLPEHLQLFTVRFPRDEKRIREIEIEVESFYQEAQTLLQRLPQAETVSV